ncbi:ATP-binding cassette domain-containing protein [Streptomyces sp. NRRL S-340]|uniref:ATP-binding cassette domain-containing protein n=1 Tax=Streptomyces sp. NRRL S-340 TaxID=1463901 RepID=UPI000564B213|nr:ATP-binding cassette domain-containing protein [Streptomyces sp. NRRL S-340]
MIQAFGLTSDSRKGIPPAVDDVSFEARAGRVTALLGTAGAGKTTTLRLMLELQQGRGITYFKGRPLHRIAHPAREVGVLLGDVPGHPSRTVRGHLRMLCAAAGLPARRADEVLEAVGLVSFREERLGTLSRGMDRRLGLACVLLTDPHTLVLDSPTRGLSAREGRWLHGVLRAHAGRGGTVLFATDDPKEAARTADRVVTLERGTVVADQEAEDFGRHRLRPRVAVRTPHAARLAALLAKEARTAHRSVEVVRENGNRLSVYGSTCADVGETAFRHGILVHQLADEIGDMGAGAGAGTEQQAADRTVGEKCESPATDRRPASAAARAGRAPREAAGAASGSAPGTTDSGGVFAAAAPAEGPGSATAEGKPAAAPRDHGLPDGFEERAVTATLAAASGAATRVAREARGTADTADAASGPSEAVSVSGRADSATPAVSADGAPPTAHAHSGPAVRTRTRSGAGSPALGREGADPVPADGCGNAPGAARPGEAPSAAVRHGSEARPQRQGGVPTPEGAPHEPGRREARNHVPPADARPSVRRRPAERGEGARRPRPGETGTGHSETTESPGRAAARPSGSATAGAQPSIPTPRPAEAVRPDASAPLPPPISVRAGAGPLRPVRYELRRALGIGTGFAICAAVLVVSALTALVAGRIGHTPQPRLLAAWPQQFPLPPAALGAGLIGALAFGDEFRHPALAADRGTVPRRLGLLAAKLLVTTAAALLLAFLTAGCDAEVLYVVYGRELTQVPGDWLAPTASWAGLVVGCGWAGVLAAGLFRSTTAGLAAVVAVPVAVAPLVRQALGGANGDAAGLPARLRETFLLSWPFGGDRYVAAAARVIAQPVGGALTLSLATLVGGYLMTTLRSRMR